MAKTVTSLTKYKSAVTVVTSDAANAWFGGLYGTAEGASLPATDPLVAGHTHDGQHVDGHAQKIDLVDHVTNQLRNVNLGTDAVDKRTVNKFETQGDAIPEYEIIDAVTYYYLDLSIIRSELSTGVFEHDAANDAVRYDESEGPTDATTDFVVGSPTLNYDAASGGSRMFFDKSQVAFRVGTTSGAAWDSAIGAGSFGWGVDTLASGTLSFAGGSGNVVGATVSSASAVNGISNSIDTSSHLSFIGGGGQYTIIGGKARVEVGNTIDNESVWAGIVAGGSNSIGSTTGAIASFIGAGAGNSIDGGDDSSIVGGDANTINGPIKAFIGGGDTNILGGAGSNSAQAAAIVAGTTNTLTAGGASLIGAGTSNTMDDGDNSFIGAGASNTLTDTNNSPDRSAIVAGNTNTIDSSDDVFIGSGNLNSIEWASSYAGIVSGRSNRIGSTGSTIQAAYGFIGGGQTNVVEEYWSSIVGGQSNTIANNAAHGFIGGGNSNTIGDGSNSTDHSAIVSGEFNVIESEWAFIGSGYTNIVNDNADYGTIAGGEDNIIGDGTTASSHGVIAGGDGNLILGTYNVIAGGQNHSIDAGSYHLIGGGISHSIEENVNASESPIYDGIFSGYNHQMYTGDAITTITVNAAGTGYSPLDIITISGGTGTSATLVVATVDGGGGISTFTQLMEGNYLSNPTSPASVTGGTGAGATFNLTFSRSLNSEYSSIAAGDTNIIGSAKHSIIAGGDSNSIYTSRWSGILSGQLNSINGSGDQNGEPDYADHSVIAGGINNTIITGLTRKANLNFIGGGTSNIISGGKKSAIISGDTNFIDQWLTTHLNSTYNLIGAGTGNTIRGEVQLSTILNGSSNLIASDIGGNIPAYTQILNGFSNNIQYDSDYSTILNGSNNIIYNDAPYGIILGGELNTIRSTSNYSVILNGDTNDIVTGADYSVILNGIDNEISAFTEHNVILNGTNNDIDTDFGISMGSYTLNKTEGAVVHSRRDFAGTTTLGSAQAEHIVLQGEASSDVTDIGLFTDGTSTGTINIESGSVQRVLVDILIQSNNSGTRSYPSISAHGLVAYDGTNTNGVFVTFNDASSGFITNVDMASSVAGTWSLNVTVSPSRTDLKAVAYVRLITINTGDSFTVANNPQVPVVP